MKKLIILFIVQALCYTTAFSENPRWKVFGTPIPPRPDLIVRWQAPTNDLPSRAWVYRLMPNRFSPQVISNLAGLCSFTGKVKTGKSSNGTTFQSSDGSRTLSISFSSGTIHYDTPEPAFGPTNLAVGVPEMSRIPELATNVLRKLQLNFSEMAGYFGTSRFEVSEPRMTTYFVHGTNVTNIPYRSVYFRRSVDGMPVVGGDGGSIYFGEHGRIRKISISWRNLERIKSFPTYSAERIVRLLHEGNAFQGLVPSNFGSINWSTVKRVTIKNARPCYCSGKSDLLYPFLALTATIETEEGKVEIEIDSSMIDEAQPLPEK
jgi:hypothetical protein